MTIQRHDIVLIVLGILFGVAGMLFVAQSWWAVLVGIVCGAGAGTILAIWKRIEHQRQAAPQLIAAENRAHR
jgi:membrane associated rhomboid family serine protease